MNCAFSRVLFYLSVGTTGDGARRTARSQACRVVGLCGERDNDGLGRVVVQELVMEEPVSRDQSCG